MKTNLALLLCVCVIDLAAQSYSRSSVFAHNDYLSPVPFYLSHHQQVGYIEADVFLQDGKLLVAHTREELKNANTFEELYLIPIKSIINTNKGSVYPDSTQKLTLMIDLKSDASMTLETLIKKLKRFRALTTCKTLNIAISGNLPDRSEWSKIPTYISFDGRPGISYTEGELQRIAFISDDFKKYSTWNGKGRMTHTDEEKVISLRDGAHRLNKKIRFWNAPDFSNAWLTFMKMEIDILHTDNVGDLTKFISNYHTNTYQNSARHQTYVPISRFAPGARPKNIILLIGDGMGLAQLYAGYTANNGSLNIFNFNTTGLSVTNASDSYITDSAAGATAMSTGNKTNNRFIGMDSLANPLRLITTELHAKGFHTAIISSGDITDATPASFYAHQPDRSMSEAIALDFLESDVDILLGAGKKSFIKRSDGMNLFHQLTQKGYTVSTGFASMDTIRQSRFVVLDDLAGLRKTNGREDFLVKALKKCIAVTQRNDSPFFMMIEGAQIDWGGHANDLPYTTTELLDFDVAVGEALRFADLNKETLVLVTADHETGGLSLTGGSIQKGLVIGNFSTNDHTSIPVPVFAFGPGAEQFSGVYLNTEIYHRIIKLVIQK